LWGNGEGHFKNLGAEKKTISRKIGTKPQRTGQTKTKAGSLMHLKQPVFLS
jgi:hypothetical protein